MKYRTAPARSGSAHAKLALTPQSIGDFLDAFDVARSVDAVDLDDFDFRAFAQSRRMLELRS